MLDEAGSLIYLTVPEIRRFWPPLRSLETLHDSIKFSQLDQFLERLMTIRTPLPSPPKTPISRDNIDNGKNQILWRNVRGFGYEDACWLYLS
uniref:Uncharacterized protein n=1 Tax=Parascaris equorum TaxID=6256 RepID=A0A914S5N6_PAREQ